MDIVYIKDLKIEAIIGIFDWERREKQTVSLNLQMAADIKKAALTDQIEDTLDYKSVAKRLIHFVGESEYQLVETLAEKICELIMSEFEVPWVKLHLSKPGAVRYSTDVGVIIERGSSAPS